MRNVLAHAYDEIIDEMVYRAATEQLPGLVAHIARRTVGVGMTSTPRHVDALVAEIGSTTTVVSAFDGLLGGAGTTPELLGQGFAPTSVLAGDVGVGVAAARAMLEAKLGPLEPGVTLATSSAAGGLRMTVHGLTQKMTAMAAREAALGAGGVIEHTTAGRLRDADLRRVDEVRPGLILLAGGVEGGDTDTVLFNAERLAGLECAPDRRLRGQLARGRRGS